VTFHRALVGALVTGQESGKRVWLPLLGVLVLAMFLCSGIATVLAGLEMGRYVAVTFLVLLIAFALICIVNGVILGRRQGNDDPPEMDT
jgi:hypothetical protein